MIVYPAIDIRAGKCVRLLQGSYEKETVYNDDPIAQAKAFIQAGATWIHVVDLDGARTGDAVNFPIIRQMVELDVKIQLGGGIRTKEDVQARMDLGVARCVIGTAAVENPELVAWAAQTYPGRIAVGIDARDGRVAVHGWEEKSALTPLELALQVKAMGVDTIIFTQVSRDGMQQGPDIPATKELAERSGLQVIVSGGVGNISHIEAGKNAGLCGVIVGKAIYDGAVAIEQALALNQPETEALFSIDQVKWDANGLVPVIAQDAQTGAVLMQAYMNRQTLQMTLEKGVMVYWSRSRQQIWEKGATSGQTQRLVSLCADCDGDSLLAQVVQHGGGACHTGAYSCFHNPMMERKGTSGPWMIQELARTIHDRKVNPKEGSYTNYLFEKGLDKILKKMGEECAETIIAAKNPDDGEVVYETADLLYHLLVMLEARDVSLEDVFRELEKRH